MDLAELKKYYEDKIPPRYIHYVEENVFQFIDNDVKIATGFLAAGFHQFIEEDKKQPIRMSFGHLSSMLLRGENIESDSKPIFADVLPEIKGITDDFKIMCLDHNYASFLTELKELFARSPEWNDAVKEKADEIIKRSQEANPDVSPIDIKFLFNFIKEFTVDNVIINEDPRFTEIPRTWSIGENISRATTGDTGKSVEDHRARVNFGDRNGSKYNRGTFDIIEMLLKSK